MNIYIYHFGKKKAITLSVVFFVLVAIVFGIVLLLLFTCYYIVDNDVYFFIHSFCIYVKETVTRNPTVTWKFSIVHQ